MKSVRYCLKYVLCIIAFSFVISSATFAASVSRIEPKIIRDQYSDLEYAVVSGFDAAGKVVWEYATEKHDSSQSVDESIISEVGIYRDRYYFLDYGVMTALDLNTGKILWRNNECSRYPYNSISSIITDAGDILFCGLNGPTFCAISNDGKTKGCIDVKKVVSGIEIEQGMVSISKLSDDIILVENPNIARFSQKYYISLADYSYSDVLSDLCVETYNDVLKTSWYSEPVTWATAREITLGTASDKFSPNLVCTRAQIITFMWRAFNKPTSAIENPFSDISSNDYYYPAALWAYEKGLVNGVTFNGEEPCSRSSVVTYLWKCSGSPTTESKTFVDVPINASYATAVAWAVNSGITNGTGTNSFTPNATCTRAQIVTFLQRYFSKASKSVSIDINGYIGDWYDGFTPAENGEGAGLISIQIFEKNNSFYMNMLSTRLASHENVPLSASSDGTFSFRSPIDSGGYNKVAGNLRLDGETIKMTITYDNDGSWSSDSTPIVLYRDR